MTVVSTETDLEALSLTLTSEFDAGVERVWQVWADPRQAERWWGPPTWPATFERHEFVVGGKATYYMTGPEGQKSHGWWRFTAIEAPHRLEVDDGFADESGAPATELGVTHFSVTLEAIDGRTRMSIVSTFETTEQLERLLGMGMEEGIKQAVGQIDLIIAKPVSA